MARRGVMNALQAALAGISGAAGGYVQMEELKRKRQKEEQDRARQEAMDAEQRRQYEEGKAERQTMNIANLISSGKAVEMREEPAGLPPSIIPLPKADQVGGRAGIQMDGRRFAIRGADELGQISSQKDLADYEERLKLAKKYATPAKAGGESTDTALRTAYINKYFTEEGQLPSATQVDEYLRLAKGGKTIADIQFAAEGETPRQRPAAVPPMAQPTGGLFRDSMLASPAGAQAAGGDLGEIRALAARLAELKRGGTMGSIAEREEYERNAPERRRVQAALDEAQRRYRPR